jgi:hypothetical protein
MLVVYHKKILTTGGFYSISIMKLAASFFALGKLFLTFLGWHGVCVDLLLDTEEGQK